MVRKITDAVLNRITANANSSSEDEDEQPAEKKSVVRKIYKFHWKNNIWFREKRLF